MWKSRNTVNLFSILPVKYLACQQDQGIYKVTLLVANKGWFVHRIPFFLFFFYTISNGTLDVILFFEVADTNSRYSNQLTGKPL